MRQLYRAYKSFVNQDGQVIQGELVENPTEHQIQLGLVELDSDNVKALLIEEEVLTEEVLTEDSSEVVIEKPKKKRKK